MSKIYVTFLSMFAVVGLYCQAPEWLWAQNAGGTNSDKGYSITYDNNNNQYITGVFFNTAVFGTVNLTSNGTSDIFVAKLDASGNWIWVIQAGGTSNSGIESGSSIVADNEGNIYLTGYFGETATFGTTTLSSVGSLDIFVAKLDINGNWLWAKRAGGINYDNGNSLAIDSSGNVLICGNYQDSADFGSTILTSIGVSDAYVAKLDSNGNWLWAKQAGGQNIDTAYSISADINLNYYISGYYSGTFNLGPFVLNSTNPNDTNIFVAKLDSDGNWLWAKKGGGISYDRCYGITVDDNGNAYITGFFYDIGLFGPYILTNNNFSLGDIFVAKLDTDGNWLWATSAGGTNDDYAYSIDLDMSGNIYLAGMFKGMALFGNTALISNGDSDIFVAKLDPSGNWLWALSVGSTEDDRCLSISVSDTGYPCLTGYFTDAVTFGDTIISSYTIGDSDIFIAKLDASYTGNHEQLNPDCSNIQSYNYPNPVKSSTTIYYHLEINSLVRIDIYNIKGQLISTLVNEPKTSGNYRVIWNGKDKNNKPVASGIYYYKLNTEQSCLTKKLFLLN